jgi:hypothetical protein
VLVFTLFKNGFAPNLFGLKVLSQMAHQRRAKNPTPSNTINFNKADVITYKLKNL